MQWRDDDASERAGGSRQQLTFFDVPHKPIHHTRERDINAAHNAEIKKNKKTEELQI